MRKILFISLALLSFCENNAQVLIGFDNASSVSSILELHASKGGIILPWVDNSASVSPISGSIIFDASDFKAKLRNNNAWVDLTNVGEINVAKLNEQNTFAESAEGVSIGSHSPSEHGILNLDSADKALLLPRFNNVNEIVQPEAGTLVYDLSRKTVAIFNGNVWSFLSTY